jgi:hypothetical protein
MKKIEYHVSLTTFDPTLKMERRTFEEWPLVAAAIDQIAPLDAVIVVEALGGGVDYGNFYLFLNKRGVAHVKLHEHREFLLVDPSLEPTAGDVSFKDEDGSVFSVDAKLTTSLPRARAALRYWLPYQAQSEEFVWQ